MSVEFVGPRLIGSAFGKNGNLVNLVEHYSPGESLLVETDTSFEQKLTRQFFGIKENSGPIEIIKLNHPYEVVNLVKTLAEAKAEAALNDLEEERGTCFVGRDIIVMVPGDDNLLLFKPQSLESARQMISIVLKRGCVKAYSGVALASRSQVHSNQMLIESEVELVEIQLKHLKDDSDINGYLQEKGEQIYGVCGAIDYAEEPNFFRANSLNRTQLDILRGLPSSQTVKTLRGEIAAKNVRFHQTRPN